MTRRSCPREATLRDHRPSNPLPQRPAARGRQEAPPCRPRRPFWQRLATLLPQREASGSEPPPAVAVAVAPAPEDRPRGCGWFDSSLDLQQGLRVQEHSAPPEVEAALAGLPLAAWLELQLQGWRPEAPPRLQAQAGGFTPAT